MNENEERTAIRDRIFNLMREGAHTDAGMERALSLAPKTVSNWRRGVSHSYMQCLPDIAAYLRVPLGILRTGTGTSADLAAEEAALLAVYREAAALPPAKRKVLLDTLCRVIRLAADRDAGQPPAARRTEKTDRKDDK